MTRQGLRDLNYYGPRPVKASDPLAETVVETTAAVEELVPATGAPLAPPVDAQDDSALAK